MINHDNIQNKYYLLHVLFIILKMLPSYINKFVCQNVFAIGKTNGPIIEDYKYT